jgi:hypothetical protein
VPHKEKVMYTAALVIAILDQVQSFVVASRGDETPADGAATVVSRLLNAWCVVLLVGVIRFINGVSPSLGTAGF